MRKHPVRQEQRPEDPYHQEDLRRPGHHAGGVLLHARVRRPGAGD